MITWIIVILAGAMVVFVAWSIKKGRGSGMNLSIDSDLLQKEMSGGTAPVILDVRSPQEFSGGHIPGAKNVTCDELIAKGFSASADTNIVVYCHSGFRSANAQRILQSKGFTRVRNLQGGVVAWKGPIKR